MPRGDTAPLRSAPRPPEPGGQKSSMREPLLDTPRSGQAAWLRERFVLPGGLTSSGIKCKMHLIKPISCQPSCARWGDDSQAGLHREMRADERSHSAARPPSFTARTERGPGLLKGSAEHRPRQAGAGTENEAAGRSPDSPAQHRRAGSDVQAGLAGGRNGKKGSDCGESAPV